MKHTGDYELEKINMLEQECADLEEENKNLTKCNLNLQEWLDNKEKVNKSLREENKKLKEKLEFYEKGRISNLFDDGEEDLYEDIK